MEGLKFSQKLNIWRILQAERHRTNPWKKQLCKANGNGTPLANTKRIHGGRMIYYNEKYIYSGVFFFFALLAGCSAQSDRIITTPCGLRSTKVETGGTIMPTEE